MPIRPWKKLSESTLATNAFWKYRVDQFELPSGKRGEYHYVHSDGAALVVPIAHDGRVHLVRQYRYLIGRDSVELPCGGVKEGESFEETAHHELAEEAGLSADQWIDLGAFVPFNGVCDEICRVFAARDLHPADATPDETEEFEQLLLTPHEVDGMIRNGTIWDGMTLAAWCMARGAGLV